MSKIRVGILRGGPSSEYDVSLKTGQSVLDNLSDQNEVSDILITKDGAWNIGGILTTPTRAMRRTDVFFNALHGAYGEDGKLQKILEHHKFPYTGSRALGSALGMNKLLSKKHFAQAGILTPRFVDFRGDSKKDEDIHRLVCRRIIKVTEALPMPWVVKPVAGGSSIGVVMANSHSELRQALLEAVLHGVEVFVEEVVYGKEATCGILDDFRGEEHFALPPLEIIAGGEGFFDYQVKYDGSSQEIPFGSFSGNNIENIQKAARGAHKILDLRHYSRTDCIVTPKGEVYVLEVNTLPGLTEESLFPKSLKAVGIHFSEFLDHVVGRALRHKQ